MVQNAQSSLQCVASVQAAAQEHVKYCVKQFVNALVLCNRQEGQKNYVASCSSTSHRTLPYLKLRSQRLIGYLTAMLVGRTPNVLQLQRVVFSYLRSVTKRCGASAEMVGLGIGSQGRVGLGIQTDVRRHHLLEYFHDPCPPERDRCNSEEIWLRPSWLTPGPRAGGLS